MSMRSPIVIVGFGSQAKAWAMNLRDSKKELIIALRKESTSFDKAHKLGIKTIELESNELLNYKNFVLLIPDHTHLDFLESAKNKIPKNANIIYAHGFSVLKESLHDRFKDWNHLLLAPKGIASEIRFQYEIGGKLAAVWSCEHSRDKEESEQLIKEIANDIGIKSLLHQGTFKEETYADLFSEQGLLCSLIPYGILHTYNTMRKQGVSSKIAYLECWYEAKLIMDTLIKLGPVEFFKLISPNALIGGENAQKLLFDKAYQDNLDMLAQKIWDGRFFKEIDQVDFEKERANIISFWENEELTSVHEDLKGYLYGSDKHQKD